MCILLQRFMYQIFLSCFEKTLYTVALLVGFKGVHEELPLIKCLH